MKVLRHTIFANGHVEFEAIDTDNVGAHRKSVLSLFDGGDTTEVAITKDNGTVSTYTKVDDLAHGRYKIPKSACGHTWSDGWGSDHRCVKVSDHTTKPHYCPCDATTRKSP